MTTLSRAAMAGIALFLALPALARAADQDFTGFWKLRCRDKVGVRIARVTPSEYEVSFCNAARCFKPGKWMPNTPITGDTRYRVFDPDTIEINSSGLAYTRYLRCSPDPDGRLDFTRAASQASQDEDKGDSPHPDYDKNPPFKGLDEAVAEKLRAAVAAVTVSPQPCKAGEMVFKEGRADNPLTVPLESNVCDPAKFSELRALVVTLAPSLKAANVTLFVTELDDDKKPELLVSVFTPDKNGEPYLSLFWLAWPGKATIVRHAFGDFLLGTIHEITTFGHSGARKVVFVKYQTCIECEPGVYLTAVDFGAPGKARSYLFTFDPDHKAFGDGIEYALPGHGHSVDAEVETRLLPPSPKGPHLVQFFDMATDPKEWWTFTCKDYRCNYKMERRKKSPAFEALWTKARKI